MNNLATVYVVDSNSFHVMGNYYPETFPSFWEHLQALHTAKRLLSVREVEKELNAQHTAAHVLNWMSTRSDMFTAPTGQEMVNVGKIFQVAHFQQLIGEKQRLRGYPVADPWLVARAMALPAVLVTEEAPKPNSAKLPNVADHFGAECIPLQEMLRREGWRY